MASTTKHITMTQKEEKLEGFFLDRDNFLHRSAVIGRGGRLHSPFGDRVKDKTALVRNTAIELSDNTWIINDTSVRRSGLWFIAEEPIAEANMHLLYDGAICGPIRQATSFPVKDQSLTWEFCEPSEATHYLIKEKWIKNTDNPQEKSEYLVGKYEGIAKYIKVSSSKAENTGHVWAILPKESVNEDLIM